MPDKAIEDLVDQLLRDLHSRGISLVELASPIVRSHGFAGSDLEFFTNFEKYFSHQSRRLSIRTNYRSTSSIVEESNSVMRERGDVALSHRREAGYSGRSRARKRSRSRAKSRRICRVLPASAATFSESSSTA